MSKEILHPSNQEMLLSAIWESSIDAMRIVNSEGITFKVNNAYCTLTGFERKSLIGKPFNIVYDEKSQESILKEFLANFLSGAILGRKEEKATCKTGKPCHIELSNSLIEISGEKFVLSIIRDITDFMQVVDSVRESEEKYRNLYRMIRLMCDNATDMIWAKDLDNRYIFANRAVCQNLLNAKDTNEPVGKTDIFFAERERQSHKDNPEWHTFGEICRDSDTVVLNSKQTERFDEFGNVQGKFLFLDVYKTPLLDEQGNIIGTVGSGRDVTQEKLLEKELQNSEISYRSIINSISEAIYIQDEQGHFLDVNLVAEKMYGYTRDFFIGNTPEFLSAPGKNDMDMVFNAVKNAFNGIPQNIEFWGIKKDGTIFPKEVSITSGTYLNKKVIITVARDVTERKKAEEDVIESEETFRKLFDESTDPILLLNDTGFTDCNQATVINLGYSSKQEFLNKHPWELSPEKQPDGRLSTEKAEAMIVKALQKGYNRFEWIHTKSDGTDFPVEVMLTPITLKGEQFFYTIWRDITKRKEAEDELRKLSRAVEQSPVTIIITDINSEIVYANPKATEITGYPLNELLGKNAGILKSGLTEQDVYKNLWDTITSGKIWSGELLNRKKNGELYWEYVNISPIMNNENIITHYLAVKEDITVRKHMQEELIKAKEQAEKMNKLKDAFIANISHEIRTPLNGILGMTQLIQNSFSQYVPENNDNYFDAIRQASTRIIRTVDMILNFSRMQIGEFPVSLKPVSLSSILDNLIKEYSSAAESKSLELSFENRCGQVILTLDEYSIIQAISNLIDNALKYSEKGFVKLILYADVDNQVKLDIQDSGIGISDDYIHQIFDPYSQEETGYSRAYEGVGLGLSLVKKYLDINGADISVASNKGEGTTFTIHFRKDTERPVLKVEFKGDNFIHEYEKLPAKPPIIRKARLRKPTILVVEDDGINQLFIISLLKNDFETVGSHNANEAMKFIEKQPFDLILMDISLKGGMNGLELTKLIRGTNEIPFTPIIAITGHSSPEDRKNCLEAGCNEFISKPFMDHELLEKIDMFIKKDE